MKQYEYKYLTIRVRSTAALNMLGKEGWMLISNLEFIHEHALDNAYEGLFMREKNRNEGFKSMRKD